MSNDTKLCAKVRETTGSNAARRLRREGSLPGAVSHLGGKTTLLQFDSHEMEVLLHHHQSESLVLKLDIEGQGSLTVQMVDVQHHNITGVPLNVDFAEISMTEKMTATVSVTMVGEALGVKNGGGMLDQQLYDVEVSCLPADLQEEITVDVSALEIGDSICIKDLDVGAKMEFLSDPEQIVAHVVPPQAEEEEAEGDAAEGEMAEPEVIGEKKDEEEES